MGGLAAKHLHRALPRFGSATRMAREPLQVWIPLRAIVVAGGYDAIACNRCGARTQDELPCWSPCSSEGWAPLCAAVLLRRACVALAVVWADLCREADAYFARALDPSGSGLWLLADGGASTGAAALGSTRRLDLHVDSYQIGPRRIPAATRPLSAFLAALPAATTAQQRRSPLLAAPLIDGWLHFDPTGADGSAREQLLGLSAATDRLVLVADDVAPT
eukprot:1725969-Prymnesium_polylepis.2